MYLGIAYDNDAITRRTAITIALEIDDGVASSHYSPGKSIFFTGMEKIILDYFKGIFQELKEKSFHVIATHLPVFTSARTAELITPPKFNRISP